MYELQRLQKEYVLCIERLQTTLDKQQVSGEAASGQASVLDEKKKEFNVVNREASYLNESLEHYLHEHNLLRERRLLRPRLTQKRPQRKTRARYQSRPRAVIDVPRKVYEDISFSLPIDRGSFWLSSPFGERRKKNGTRGYHWGIDMAAVRGTPVKAVAAGEVIELSYSPKGYGNTIVIQHAHRFKTRYAHLHSICVKLGQCVEQGEMIGRVGSTGHVRSSYGKDPSHLHFEVMESQRKINPLWVLPKIN